MITTLLFASMTLAEPTLKDLGAKHKIKIGACVNARQLQDPKYMAILTKEFNVLEPENELKFGPVHPERDRYDFATPDAMAAVAKANKMMFRGHTLVWHNQNANWVREGKFTPVELNAILKKHIFDVLGRYKGKVKQWDVVNEAIADNGTRRSSIWADQPGIGFADQGYEYIAQAFRWAHEADPKAKLYYNDYSVEWIGPKSEAMIAMVAKLKADKVPIHGVGLQCHFDLQFGNEGAVNSFRQVIRRLKALKLDVQVTEMDVRIDANTPESVEKQSWIYYNVVKAAVEEKVSLIQFWGITDRDSWIPYTFRGMGWALSWDDQFQKKPAYHAIAKALKE